MINFNLNIYFKVLFLFLIIVLFSIFFYIFFLGPPKDFKINNIVNIEQGTSLRLFSKSLKESNYIRSRVVFEAFVISFGGEKHILPGDYLFEKRLPVFEIARRISQGERNVAPIKITIPEGFDISEIAEVVDLKLSNFNKNKFLLEAKEGYMFPDTYFFFTTDNDEDVLKLMSDNFEKKFATFRTEISKVGKTEKEIIIMASIIEREAKGDNDRELISGILWKRLDIGMALQVDATPVTYKEKGLPESPISNPGLESIRAAIYPKLSSYLFYLHGKDGEIHYARTFTEHKKNKIKYLK